MDFAQRDLYENIEKGNFPKWNLKIQVMTEQEAKNAVVNPFDVTKVWPHKDYPLIDVGVLELNKNPENYFQDVEQAAFSPAHIVDGIGFSPDKMLQGRILSYSDAQRYRLGANYEQIPVNRCPFMAINNYQRDGLMRIDGNGGSKPNYYPNSFDNIEADQNYAEPAFEIESTIADHFDRNAEGENDHFSQPGNLYRLLSQQDKENTISNIINSMNAIDGEKREEIILRQLCHWFRADTELGMHIAKGLNIDISKHFNM
jgi:catalase